MKRSELFFSVIRVPLDYLALILAGFGAYFLRYWRPVQEIRPVIFDLKLTEFAFIVLLICAGWILIFAIMGMYRTGSTQKLSEEFAQIFVGCSAGLAFVLAVMVFSRYLFDSRFIILVGWFLAIVFVSIERLIIKLIQKQALKRGIGVHRVVVIGDGYIAEVLKKEFAKNIKIGYRIVEEFNDCADQTIQRLKQLVAEDKFDEIILTSQNFSPNDVKNLLELVDDYHLTFNYAADLLGLQSLHLEVKNVANVPVVEVKKTRLDGWGRIYKRIIDIVGSLALLIIFSPVMIMIAIAIKLDSPGSIFFKYKRIGQYGKPFSYFKFRSMVKDAHRLRFDPEFLQQQKNLRDGTPMMKFKNDPRITRVGKYIRRYSLDELPELFLVLVGKMSLVGPRPHEIEEVQKYQHYHKKVLTLKPGITGLAQVSGRSDLNFDQEVKLDVYYIENWTFFIDWKIILKTPAAVLQRREAE